MIKEHEVLTIKIYKNLHTFFFYITGKATSFYDKNSDQALSSPLVKIFEQAQQEVPEWLIEIANTAPGSSNAYGGTFGGNFTSSDIRSRKGAGQDTIDYNIEPVPIVDDDDEEWD